MKATLEFDLPEDTDEHYLAVNGAKYRHTLSDFNQYLNQLMRGKVEIKGYDISTVEKLHEYLWDCMEDWNINVNNDVS